MRTTDPRPTQALSPTVTEDLPVCSVGDVLRMRAGDQNPGLRFEDETWTWAEVVEASARRAAWLEQQRREGPFHIAVLLENVPDFVFLLGAAGIGGAVIVSLNPTRRGAELARDIEYTDCQLLVTDSGFAELLKDVDLPFPRDRVCFVDSPEYRDAVDANRETGELHSVTAPDDLYMLIFTSGTSGTPKAVRYPHRTAAMPGFSISAQYRTGAGDVLYAAMPLFHSNAIITSWSHGLASGATIAMRRRFSASAFLPDVRRYGVTFFGYVGKPLSYVLATPEHPDDADNTLRLALGNEGADGDLQRFAARFGCQVFDAFGSTEGGVGVHRTPDTPPGSIGKPRAGIVIANPETSQTCPPARFDERGQLLNAEEAIGEMVNTTGAGLFQGYYRNEEANAERMRGGWYWSGDLAYADEQGFYYFAGRTLDWLRVDGENFAAAPVERVLERHPDIVLAPVFAVPAVDVGDDVMTALLLRDDAKFDGDEFARFLGAQPDLGTKWVPRYVRIARSLPQTETNKVLKRELARERWDCDDDVWWRPGREIEFRRLTEADAQYLAGQRSARSGGRG